MPLMWKKIDSYLIVADISAGDIITNKPDDPVDQYEIKSLHAGYVRARHSNGKIALKIFPEKELMSGKW